LNILVKSTLCVFCIFGSASAETCDDYLMEAEAVSGIVPRFNQDGSLRSILTHGEATFMTAKRSLINTARRKAELNAKHHFSNFLSEDVSAEIAVSSALEQAELTDQDGKTEGYVLELSQSLNAMRSNTSATLKGLIKLDECVDTKENFVLVTLGWKPKEKFEAETNTAENPANTSSNNAKNSNSSQSTPNITPSSTEQENSSGPGITIVTVNIEGYGHTQNAAIDDGLRLAVAQVFGELFSASMASARSTSTLELSTSDGSQEGVAAETSTEVTAIASSTSGIIESYSINSVVKSNGETVVSLEVNLPKYTPSSNTQGKLKIIVFEPSVIAGNWTFHGENLSKQIQREVESLLNETNKLTALNRENQAEQDIEISRLEGNDFAVSEAAKIGNRLGADFIIITEFSKFDTRQERVKIGNSKSVSMNITEAQAWIKVIDIASTNTVLSVRVPLSARSVKKEQSADAFAITMAHNLATVVGENLGGGFTDLGKSLMSELAQKSANFALAKERLKKAVKKIEKEVKDDW